MSMFSVKIGFAEQDPRGSCAAGVDLVRGYAIVNDIKFNLPLPL